MSTRRHRIAALSLTALGLAPGATHVLELPVKLAYPAELYAAVTATLYAWFGLVGGAVQVLALVTVAVLAIRERHAPTGRLLAAAAAALFTSLLLWAAVVAPVNATWAALIDPAEVVPEYARLRARWEFGHVAAFIAWLTGWLGLVSAATQTSPTLPAASADKSVSVRDRPP